MTLAARAAHHEFPFGMGVMSQLMSCTNGAKTDIFPGGPNPLVLPGINVNVPQTRKSSGYRAGLSIGSAIDEVVLAAAKKDAIQQITETADEGTAPADEHHPSVKALQVQSSTMSSFTEPAFM